jgi:FkbM family methyltransferase
VNHLPIGFSRCLRQVQSCLNARRLGVFFVRARSFKMPQKLNAAGKTFTLQYLQERGASTDFIACCIRNDYGLHQQLSNVKTILDIGGNVGFFSVAARAHYPQATIHTYEPNPRVLPCLKSNTAELGISVYSEAVGAESGLVSIVDEGDSSSAFSQSTKDGTIPKISLDVAVERLGGSVDLLKLDCEGAEWDMFRSSNPWRHIRNIRMEYHLFHGETVADVGQALNGLGFEITKWNYDVGFGILWAKRSNRFRD